MKKYLVLLLMFVLVFSFAEVGFVEEGFSENGHWFYGVEEDPMTDEIEIYFMLNDENNMGDDFNNYDAKSIMIRKLSEFEPEILIGWSDYLADNNEISWRFDKGDIQTGNWSLAQNKKALFHPGDQSEKMNFVKQLLQVEQVAIEVQPHEQTKDSAVFQPEGLGEVLLPYLEELGWEELESVINKE